MMKRSGPGHGQATARVRPKNFQNEWRRTFGYEIRVSGRCSSPETGDGKAALHGGREAAEELEQDDAEAVHVAFEVDLPDNFEIENYLGRFWINRNV